MVPLMQCRIMMFTPPFITSQSVRCSWDRAFSQTWQTKLLLPFVPYVLHRNAFYRFALPFLNDCSPCNSCFCCFQVVLLLYSAYCFNANKHILVFLSIYRENTKVWIYISSYYVTKWTLCLSIVKNSRLFVKRFRTLIKFEQGHWICWTRRLGF